MSQNLQYWEYVRVPLLRIYYYYPFYPKDVPIILGDHVTTDAGTGCVHTAPDHGIDDFIVGKKYNIETLNLVSGNGVYNENTPLFSGQHVYKVDDLIIDTLKENQRLFSVKNLLIVILIVGELRLL